ncbi:MAG TPA: hypothetical protein DCP97_05935 [Ruminococcaceae bacterium]|nr:hypothetical protein [Oscillospiraceae bacterium]
MKKLMRFISPYMGRAVAGILLKIAGTFTDLALPYLMAYIIDNCIEQQRYKLIAFLGGIMFLFAVSGVLTNVISNKFAAEVSQNFARDLRNSLFSHIQSFSFKEFDSFGTPSLITRMTADIYNVQNMVLQMLRMVIRAPLLFLGGVIMAVIIDPLLSMVLIFTTPLLIYIVSFAIKKTVPIYKRLQGALDKLIMVLRENLSGIRTVRALSMTSYEYDRFKQANMVVKGYEIESGKITSLVNPAMTLVMNAGLVAAIWFGGMRVNAGGMLKGEVLAFSTYFTQILGALLSITKIFINYTRAAASASRINEVFDVSTSISIEENKPQGDEQYAIEFRNVTFAYPMGDGPALNNISFKLKKGSTLAIIGGTGSGKTTIINLIMRLYDPQQGDIFIDGRHIASYELTELRHKLGIVLQQSMLFSQSVESNIKWGRQNAVRAQVCEAASTAQASEFIESLPHGYETMISQGGTNFSGGQRQRLSIARALIKYPEILIFDDSSSALDYATDAKLRSAVKQKFNNTSVLIIAQRISSVMFSDNILVLDDGNLVGCGTHTELLDNCEIYREISQSQLGGAIIG